MELIWDERKNAGNRQKHRIGFEALQDFNWRKAEIADRSRHEDGEPRFAAIGLLKGKLYTVIYTWRGDDMRIISLRRSNSSEEKAYAQRT